jgi:hypothetical protein
VATVHDTERDGAPAGEPPVELVRWPVEAARRDHLANAGIPRLLLVAQHADLPGHLDLDEDWVREPVTPDDLHARLEHLRHLAAVLHREEHLHVDDQHVLHRGDLTARLSVTEARIVEVLLAHRMVTRRQLRDAWPDDVDVRPGAVDAAVSRLRKRVRGLGLQIRPVRGEGYELHVGGAGAAGGEHGQFTRA